MPIMHTVLACRGCAIYEKIQQRHMRAVFSGFETNVSDEDLAVASGQINNFILKGAQWYCTMPHHTLPRAVLRTMPNVAFGVQAQLP